MGTEPILGFGELVWVAFVELGGGVELLVASGGCVGSNPHDAGAPFAGGGQSRRNVGGVGAVDHEVLRFDLAVDLGERGGQWSAVGKPAVLLDGEGNRDRQPGGTGGADDAHGLAGPGEGEGCDQVSPGLGEGFDLGCVIGGRGVRIDYLAGDVPVSEANTTVVTARDVARARPHR